jgi:ERCC4-type nuclease
MPTKPKHNYTAKTDEIIAKDCFQTPDYAIDPLLPYILDKFNVVWESACGEGYLAKNLQRHSFQVIATDLPDHNYFEYQPNDYDIEITNVPFSKKYQWLKLACEHNKPFALLMPSDVLFAGARAQPLIKQYNLELLIPDKRINFKTPINGWDNSNAQMHTSWITRGLGIGRLITFVEINPRSNQEPNMIDVIVNTMRPNTEISVSPNKQFSITESELNVGDVWAIDEHGVITIILVVNEEDLKSLVFSNEIFRKAEAMRSITPWSYIIRCYSYSDSFNHGSTIEGALLSLQELGVIIAYTENTPDVISERITQIITRDRRNKRNEPRRNFVTTTDGETILLSLPGIGPAKLATLLNECGIVAMALCALTDVSIKTPLITTDQKLKIRKALELDDDMILAPVPATDGTISRGKTDARQPVSNSGQPRAE